MKAESRLRVVAMAALLVSLGASISEAALVRASEDFTHKYEGEYPVTNYSQVNGGFTTAPSSDGNILTFATPDTNGGYFDSVQWTGATVTNATGWTYEFRLQILDDVVEAPSGTVQFVIGDSAGFRAFRVFKSFFTARFPTDVTMDANSNTDGYHTFRIAREPGSSDYLVWRDGVSLANVVGSDPAAGGATFMYFGDGSTSVGGPTVKLDYLRFDNTGAYAPVPEPSTLFLLSMGAFVLSGRIRGRKGFPLIGKCLAIAALAVGSMSTLCNWAAAVEVKDSTEFSHKYEGNILPIPDYTQINGGFRTEPSTDNDILTYASPNLNGGYFDSNVWASAIDYLTGWTVEWRLKVIDDFEEAPSGTLQFVMGDEAGFRAFRIFKNFFTTRFPTDVTLSSDPNTDAFHTFRVAREPGSFDYLVWYDDQFFNVSETDGAAGGVEFFYFGDGSTNVGGPTVEIDYVRFDNTGAYAPFSVTNFGDFNGDGTVDAADYTVWRNNFGASDESSISQNGDGLNGVDQADYLLWKDNFGTVFGAGSVGSANVPEPCSGLLLVTVAGSVLMTRRRLVR